MIKYDDFEILLLSLFLHVSRVNGRSANSFFVRPQLNCRKFSSRTQHDYVTMQLYILTNQQCNSNQGLKKMKFINTEMRCFYLR